MVDVPRLLLEEDGVVWVEGRLGGRQGMGRLHGNASWARRFRTMGIELAVKAETGQQALRTDEKVYEG